MSVVPHVVRRGDGIPLVAVHGNGVDHRLLLALDESLAVAGTWERIYLDLPGFGRTPPMDGLGGLPELADWLVETVGGLVGDQRFALLANSIGGLLARHVASRFPQQVLGLALIAPVVDPDPARRVRPPRAVVEYDDALLGSLPTADREEFTAVATRQVEDSWQAFRAHALPGIRAADAGAMERLGQRYFLRDVPEEVAPAFEGPVLLVAGRQDHVVGFQDQLGLLAHYPHATCVVVDGAGHNVHLEQPGLVESAVRDWSVRAASGTSTALTARASAARRARCGC